MMSNSCIGKTMENLRRRGMLRLVTTEAQAETSIYRATFKKLKIISKKICSYFLSGFQTQIKLGTNLRQRVQLF